MDPQHVSASLSPWGAVDVWHHLWKPRQPKEQQGAAEPDDAMLDPGEPDDGEAADEEKLGDDFSEGDGSDAGESEARPFCDVSFLALSGHRFLLLFLHCYLCGCCMALQLLWRFLCGVLR